MSKLSDETSPRRSRRVWLFVAGLPVIAFCSLAVWMAWAGRESGPPSRCHGGVVGGRLEGGRRLPLWGENYSAYSVLGFMAGRTFMHRSVRDAALAAYATVAKEHPELHYVYAESGWPWGGSFAPHKSHTNGTSVDFHVPVRSLDGTVSELPASVFNKLGYAINFDTSGRSGNHRIDFEAMALHLLALEQAARANGISIGRVIFDIRLQPKLFATAAGARVSRLLSFNKVQSWVPHDQHYHVDFKVPCR
jgi:penicillin-insensitive murein endopeptidase